MDKIFWTTECNAPCIGMVVKDSLDNADKSMTDEADEFTRLIQTDYEYPGIASTFGWDITTVKPTEEPDGYVANWRDLPEHNTKTGRQLAPFRRYERQCKCEHRGTDGTVDCPDCKLDASVFMESAGEWLRENDGAEAEDPGYFNG